MTSEVSGSDILQGMLGNSNVIVAESAQQKAKEVIYWRKCLGCDYHTRDNGYITIGPAMSPRTAIEFSEFQANKHATPLPQFGRYVVGKVTGQKYDLTNPATKYAAIIELGGIKEFPLEQMIEYNWHRYEVMRRVRPELEQALANELTCIHGCVNRKFNTAADYQAHCSVMHKDIIQSESIGRQFKEAITNMGGNGTGQLNADLIQQIAIAMSLAMKNIPDSSVTIAKQPLVSEALKSSLETQTDTPQGS